MAEDIADNILKSIFLNENCRILILLEFVPRVQLTISYYWFKQWLGAEQAIIHYLNQWGPSLLEHIWTTQPQCVKQL